MLLHKTIRRIIDHPLNRHRALASIIRFAKWQIGSRLVPGAIVYDWVNGSKFFVKTGETGLTGNIYAGLDEFADMGFLLHYLRAEDLFVDIGANAGSFTILACSVAKARGIAFEPIPSTFKRLVDNVHLNYLHERVKCMNKGVGGQEGKVAFTGARDTTNHALAPDEQCEDKIVVEVTTLDIALSGEEPSLMKIDVEGYEAQVLEGGKKTLSNKSLMAVIMELNGTSARYGSTESEILELMLGYGFRTYSYDPFERRLVAREERSLNSANTLFIRDESFVKTRLKGAPRVNVNGREL